MSGDAAYSVQMVDHLTRAQATQCEALQLAAGPVNGKAPRKGGRAWLALDGAGMVVGFTTAARSKDRRRVDIVNCVVAPSARGNELQARMTRRVLAWAVGGGAECVCTYTASDNWHSAANLVAVGFKVERIEPTQEAAGAGAWIHFRWGAAA